MTPPTAPTDVARVDLGGVETLLTDTHREPRRASDTRLIVPLVSMPPHVVEIEPTPSATLRLSVAVVTTEGWPEPCRLALAVYLDRVGRGLRGPRAVLEDGHGRLELELSPEPSETELTAALAALEAAARYHVHEARALEDETLARVFVSTVDQERKAIP